MPSYPINYDASITPFAATDFDLGIAEKWLEAARDGFAPGKAVPETRPDIDTALEHCRRARETLRTVIPVIHRGEGDAA